METGHPSTRLVETGLNHNNSVDISQLTVSTMSYLLVSAMVSLPHDPQLVTESNLTDLDPDPVMMSPVSSLEKVEAAAVDLEALTSAVTISTCSEL